MSRSTTTFRTRTVAAVTGAVLLMPAAALALGPIRASGPLTDLATSTSHALDDATARVQVVPAGDQTLVTLQVHGIDATLAGTPLGAHLHTGSCVEDDGPAAGPHFNIEVHEKVTPAEVSPHTEVWLDFTVTEDGTGSSVARVPFLVPDDAAASIVIHALPTAPDGSAGARVACLPVDL